VAHKEEREALRPRAGELYGAQRILNVLAKRVDVPWLSVRSAVAAIIKTKAREAMSGHPIEDVLISPAVLGETMDEYETRSRGLYGPPPIVQSLAIMGVQLTGLTLRGFNHESPEGQAAGV